MVTRRELGAKHEATGTGEPSPSRLVASILARAVRRTADAPTIQEGLHEAYTRDLCVVEGLEGLPEHLLRRIDALMLDLGSSLGFDCATREKPRSSTLGDAAAAVLFARLQALSVAADAVAEER